MRFSSLTLRRFGHFADREVLFTRGTPDFHVIVGANEAGKSTLRAAVSSLLFGFDLRTPWAFRFDTSDLALQATLQHGAQELEFVRVKRRNGTLRRLDDSALPDNALEPWLGGITRSSFESMFSLDHQQLRDGGRRLLDSSDDAGRQLFEASAGLAGLSRIKQALDSEADGIWSLRKGSTKSWYVANDALEAAEREKRASTVTTGKYQEARGVLEVAERELVLAHDRLTELRTRQAQLNRVRRIAPRLAARAELLAQRDSLGPVPPFPSDAAEQLQRAKERLRTARETVQLQQTRIQLAVDWRARETVDPAYEDHADAIRALRELAVARSAVPEDLQKRRGELSTHQAELQRAANDLVWSTVDEARIRERIPNSVARTAILRLIERHTELRTRLDGAQREARLAQARLERARASLSTAQCPPPPAALRAAIAAVEIRGDVIQQAATLALRIAEVEAQQPVGLAQLRPWTGSVAELRGVAVLDQEAIGQFEEALRVCRAGTERAAQRVNAANEALGRAEQRVERLRRGEQLVTADAVVAARAARDSFWAQLTAGQRSLSSDGDEYEGLVHAADEMADRRLAHASEAAELDQAIHEREALFRELGAASEDLRGAQEREAQCHADWALQIEPLPSTCTTTRYRAWSMQRAQVLAAENLADGARAAREVAREQIRAISTLLVEAISPIAAPFGGPDFEINALLAQARDVTAEIEAARNHHAKLESTVADLEDSSTRRADDVTDLEAQIATWESEWFAAMEAAHLRGMTPEQARDALQQIVGLSTILERIDSLRRRISGMEEQVRHLDERVDALADVFPRRNEESTLAYTARLSTALDANEQAARNRRDADAEVEAAELARQSALDEVSGVEADLAELYRIAAVGEFGDLERTVGKWALYRSLADEIVQMERHILGDSDGLPLDALTTEAAQNSPDKVLAEILDLESQINGALADVQQMVRHQQQAKDALDRIGLSSPAADAEFARQRALARLTEATERFLRVRIAERLLHWSVEKFRAEKQGPLLARANQLFEQLTLGRFDRLIVDADDGAPILKARRRDGTYVTVDGMSEGTVDQLYLSLRLAAVDLHLTNARSLPFIADDLIVNFDEERGAAALRALIELSTRTQVVFLTHHEFVASQACEVAEGPLNVIRLGEASAAAA